MTTEPAEPAQPDVREEPDPAMASEPQGDSDNDTDSHTDMMGIDDDDPIDATLVGESVNAKDDGSDGEPG